MNPIELRLKCPSLQTFTIMNMKKGMRAKDHRWFCCTEQVVRISIGLSKFAVWLVIMFLPWICQVMENQLDAANKRLPVTPLP